MKKLRVLALVAVVASAAAFGGCARFRADVHEVDAVSGVDRRTTVRVSTFWDSSSQIAKLRTTNTAKSQGVGLSGLTEESSGTNAVAAIESIVGAAVRAVVKP